MKTKFNELDRWLLQNWSEAYSFEQSLETARIKYESVLGAVVEKVQETIPELDIAKINITNYKTFGGHMGFSKQNWPSHFVAWPSGLWIGKIGLENLTAETGEQPSAYIWIREPKNGKVDLVKAKARISKAARQLLDDPQLSWMPDDNKWSCGYYDLPASRQNMVKMLLEKDSTQFIDYLSEHFCRLARFVSILDELLLK